MGGADAPTALASFTGLPLSLSEVRPGIEATTALASLTCPGRRPQYPSLRR